MNYGIESYITMIAYIFSLTSIDQNRNSQSDKFVIKLNTKGRSGCLAPGSDNKRAID
jgi:hypothetical protein